jgi:hypothetical protein
VSGFILDISMAGSVAAETYSFITGTNSERVQEYKLEVFTFCAGQFIAKLQSNLDSCFGDDTSNCPTTHGAFDADPKNLSDSNKK